MTRTACGLALMIGLVGCAPSADRGVPAGEEDVRSFLEAYYTALSDRDWRRFEEHFWPGAMMATVWQPPGEPVERVVATSIPDFVAMAPQGPGSREIFEERLVTADLTISGDLAQAWVRYAARFGDPGDIAEWEGTDAFTLLRHDGQWRITSLAYVPE